MLNFVRTIQTIDAHTGSAHISGFNQWVLEQSDPFPTGFFFR